MLWNNDADVVFQRLLTFLASPQTAPSDRAMGEWMPTPAAIAQLELEHPTGAAANNRMLPLAAEAFLQLGRDDDAAEAARIGLLPEQHTHDTFARGKYHRVLGRVAAKRGNAEEAGGHFGRALEEAKALPMLQLLAARDWKRSVSASGAAADAAIDAACAKMGKSRAELASVL